MQPHSLPTTRDVQQHLLNHENMDLISPTSDLDWDCQNVRFIDVRLSNNELGGNQLLANTRGMTSQGLTLFSLTTTDICRANNREHRGTYKPQCTIIFHYQELPWVPHTSNSHAHLEHLIRAPIHISNKHLFYTKGNNRILSPHHNSKYL